MIQYAEVRLSLAEWKQLLNDCSDSSLKEKIREQIYQQRPRSAEEIEEEYRQFMEDDYGQE